MLRQALLSLLLIGLVAPAWAAVNTSTHTTYQVRRGSSNLGARPTSKEECIRRAHEAAELEGAWRESGANDFQCHEVLHVLAIFRPNTAPTCGDRPGEDEQLTRTCPAGTVGTWLQDRSWTLHAYPECWVQGEWEPTAPPEGMCAPADSDGDGVPDSADQCPTVHASTPNGCPASPQPLPAPANVRAEAVSTSRIRVNWDAVPGAATYSVRRCIGGSCEPLDNPPLLCVPALEVEHSTLPPELTVSYRLVASATADCSVLGEPSGIVRATTLAESTPAPSGTAALSWTLPNRNTDGTSITNLAGTRIHYGTSPDALVQTIQVSNPTASAYTVTGLAPGTWYFAVRAYNTGGRDSALSTLVMKVVQ